MTGDCKFYVYTCTCLIQKKEKQKKWQVTIGSGLHYHSDKNIN